MKSLVLVMAVAAIAGIKGSGQPKTPYGQSDPAAKAILDQVSKSFKSYRTVSADFTLSVKGQDNSVQDSKSGTIQLKGTKYRITLENQELYCDGKITWTYTRDANEVQVNNYEPDNNTITPSRLFTDFYDKEFLYRLDGKTMDHGKKLDDIEMTPLDKSKPFFKVVLGVDEKAKLISQAVVFDKDGNQYSYEISHFRPNLPLSDSVFIFNPATHPHAEVVDLR